MSGCERPAGRTRGRARSPRSGARAPPHRRRAGRTKASAPPRGAQKEEAARADLLATGLGNSRGNDYFQRRLLFPLADARGNVRGFQARKLYDDDRLTAKYVNSPESDLFKKGDLLYGLDSARQPIAKEDRAVVVEATTDVIALRHAGV